MDAVQAAHSGHPGMPMGMAEIATVLWRKYLRHDPAHPHWPNRDRFVLSNGHGSILHYALLHLTGYDLDIKQFKRFRQFGSKTPGHPELGLTPGIEATTGPLGQGLGNAVGMALSERLLAHTFNQPDFELFDHYTYAFVGDGCLMEGISQEVCSLAGTLGLGKLIVFYDNNGISIDGQVSGWFTDDTPQRFQSMGWHVVPIVDGHDMDQIEAAIDAARSSKQPSLICCQTVIGRGAPNKQGSAEAHGAPLGEQEVLQVRETLDWDYPPFEIPKSIYRSWCARKAGKDRHQKWKKKFRSYRTRHPGLAAELIRREKAELPDNFDRAVATHTKQFQNQQQQVATRKALQMSLDAMAPVVPELIGGSADLTSSNNTRWSGSKVISQEELYGNYIHFGVREFGMFAILNGLALSGMFIPYGGTFLVFSDYCRSALRLAAMMELRCLQVFTHDSVGVGEDGPTHQPIEQLASLRLIPNLNVWRPCDKVETLVAVCQALKSKKTPSALILSRQKLNHQQRRDEQLQLIERGGYILHEPEGNDPSAIIVATGSEVGLAVQTAVEMADEGVAVRVVSMPCYEIFCSQDDDYRAMVLSVKARVIVEAGSSRLWQQLAGPGGVVLGIDQFGKSASGEQLLKHYHFTTDKLKALVNQVLTAAEDSS